MFTRPVRKTLVLNIICTVCITQAVYYISLLCVKYGMHAYAGPACICRMHAPSMHAAVGEGATLFRARRTNMDRSVLRNESFI